MGVGTQTLHHRSVAMHGLLQQVLPAILRIVYPARDSEALAPVGDVPRGVEVLVSVCDPVLRYG